MSREMRSEEFTVRQLTEDELGSMNGGSGLYCSSFAVGTVEDTLAKGFDLADTFASTIKGLSQDVRNVLPDAIKAASIGWG